MGFLASAHAQGRGTPPLHSGWPKVSVKARQSELYEYSWIWKITAVKSEVSESSVSSKDARQRCLRVRWCDPLMAYSLEWGNPCFPTLGLEYILDSTYTWIIFWTLAHRTITTAILSRHLYTKGTQKPKSSVFRRCSIELL